MSRSAYIFDANRIPRGEGKKLNVEKPLSAGLIDELAEDSEGVQVFLQRARELNTLYGKSFDNPQLLVDKAERVEAFTSL